VVVIFETPLAVLGLVYLVVLSPRGCGATGGSATSSRRSSGSGSPAPTR